MNVGGWTKSLVAAAVLLAAVLVLPLPGAAQDPPGDGAGSGAEEERIEEALAPVTGQWKKNFWSPSFGVVLYKARIEHHSAEGVTSNLADNEKEYYTPALDLRIFRGINITKSAGFFWGLEAGAAVFLPCEESFDADVTVNDTVGPYTGSYNNVLDSGIDTFNVTFYGGTVFLMLKYGYRLEFGSPKLGFSAGLHLGTGASLFSGGYDVYAGSRENPVAEGGYGTSKTTLDIATDISVELALRIRTNFRLFAAAGMLMTPFEIGDEKRTSIPGSEVLNDPAPTNEEYLEYALNTYEVDVDGFGFSMRAGFSLNFN
jgi:hypothetical protein